MNGDAPETTTLTVAEFYRRLRKLFERVKEFRRITILGEVADFKIWSNGNAYFKLKEGTETLECFAFASEVKKFPPIENGMLVCAAGSVGLMEMRSQYQLRVFEIEPAGAGALAAQLEALRKKLEAEGAFEEARKRPIPLYPLRVAVVSASKGEGARDFLTTLREKAPNVAASVFDTRVQGVGAEIEIADAIDRAGRSEADVIVVLRGGGASGDRAAFNMEPVVRAILRSRHPVVTAIGHTGNLHLADDVADASFKTPTAAAESIAFAWAQTRERLAMLRDRLRFSIKSIVDRKAQQSDAAAAAVDRALLRFFPARLAGLTAMERRLDAVNPQRRLGEWLARATSLSGRIDAAFERAMSRKRHAWGDALAALDRALPAFFAGAQRRLERLEGALAGLDPLRPLELGYAIVVSGGKAVRDASALRPGDEIQARFERGTALARVESIRYDG